MFILKMVLGYYILKYQNDPLGIKMDQVFQKPKEKQQAISTNLFNYMKFFVYWTPYKAITLVVSRLLINFNKTFFLPSSIY